MNTMNIAEFLLAQIADDELRAGGTGLLGWATYRADDGSMIRTEPVGTTVDAPNAWFSDEDPEDVGATVQVVHDQRRVLAESDAKRNIVRAHEPRYFVAVFNHAAVDSGATCGSCRSHDGDSVTWPCVTLRELAKVYADRPDYDETWRP